MSSVPAERGGAPGAPPGWGECRAAAPQLLPSEAKSSALGNSSCLKAPAVRSALEMGLQVAPPGRDVHNLWG